MNHTVDRLVAQQRGQPRRIADVGFDQLAMQHGVGMAVAEIVHHHAVMAQLRQLQNRMRADKAGTAGHQNAHGIPP